MPKKRHKPEEIVAKMRQLDVLVLRGQSVADAARAIGVSHDRAGSSATPTCVAARASVTADHAPTFQLDKP